MLRVADLTVRYGPFLALDGVFLTVAQGEVVGLIGPNGAGKSSILRAIAGLVPPSAGAIELKGHSLLGVQPHERVGLGVVLVPEGRGLFANMSVEENLLMGAYALKDAARARENMERVFALFPILKERRRQLGGTLSGGQQQMLAIGTGLMSNPELCMFDEPSMGLAPIVIGEIAQRLQGLRKTGVTVLLAEQNAKLASEVADRIYILQTGRIRFHDSPQKLLENPEVVETYLSVY
ncbi:MAG TPA: ABC transporter ATP-binding protein [Syntrophales bacterium]|nr:ABC transporter ATP-binding protein [Syntrophales bacterium]